MPGDPGIASGGDEEAVQRLEWNTIHRAASRKEGDGEEAVFARFDIRAGFIFLPTDEVFAFAQDAPLALFDFISPIVDDIEGFFDHQGTRFAVDEPSIVIEAVGEVARFLDLDQGDPFSIAWTVPAGMKKVSPGWTSTKFNRSINELLDKAFWTSSRLVCLRKPT